MRIELFAAALVLLAIGWVRAAIPPLPEQVLREGADVIVTGVITKVEHEDRAHGDPDYVNRHYTITIGVTKVEKGSVKAESVVAHTWQTWKRPSGWAGPQGQNLTPTQDATVRAYLRNEAGESSFTLMLPNGLEEIAPTTKPSR